jgi:hypothetical protein
MHGKCSGKVASLPTGNDTALKDIGFKHFFMLKKQLFGVASPCGWVIASRRLEGTLRLHLTALYP